MLIKSPPDIPASEITPESVYRNRRQFMRDAGLLTLSASLGSSALALGDWPASTPQPGPAWLQSKVAAAADNTYKVGKDDMVTPWEIASTHNNFFEFGVDKDDPADRAGQLTTDPWSVEIAGEANKTGTYTLEDILKPHDMQERIYRLRCVEAWSMVIPWVGFSLADLLARFEPAASARYVRFTTLYRPEEMPAQLHHFATLNYPYVEGLRMDEAMNPLAMIAVGMYGQTLPPQNGAPLRLVVPWKYGFKSIKSIVKIEFIRTTPVTSWSQSAPSEYGFYANVNPQVAHPRWSQATERRLPSSLFSPNRRDTLMFNGYAEQVASLYTGMDLRRFY